jgi:hypothetical protein
MDKFTSRFFAEHVNNQLKNNQVDNKPKPVMALEGLRQVNGFAAAFEAQLKHPLFIKGLIAQDLAKGSHNLSMSLLFILEYLRNGPGFLPWKSDTFNTSPSCTMITTWGTTLLSSGTVDPKTLFQAFAKISAIVLAPDTKSGPVVRVGGLPIPIGLHLPTLYPVFRDILSKVTDSQGNLRAKFNTGVGGVFALVATATDSTLDQLFSDDKQQFVSLVSVNASLFETHRAKWIAAVADLARVATQDVRQTFNDFGRGFIMGLTLGMEDHREYEITTWTGLSVAYWIDQGTLPSTASVVLGLA